MGLIALAACGHGGGVAFEEPVSQVEQALGLPLETPVPNGWTGNRAELALLDAFAECSFIQFGPSSPPKAYATEQGLDPYLSAVLTKAAQLTCNGNVTAAAEQTVTIASR
jgi:hypothetical protein